MRKLLGLSLLLFIILAACQHRPAEGTADTDPALDSLPTESSSPVYTQKRQRIARNERLADLLSEHQVEWQVINRLALDKTFDVRKMRSGNQVDFYYGADSLPDHMIYHHSPQEHYIFHLRDSIYVEARDIPVVHYRRQASGEISSSLWECMMENDLHPSVAVELSEIYAWSIDFFGLQKGDAFKLLYEESYVDTVSVGIRRILGAVFYHGGDSLYAIPFIQGGKHSYYDLFGNSLRKQFLKAPLQYSRISSRFSYNRLHPILKIRRPHLGVDYAAPRGTPVLAVGDGTVTQAAWLKNSGRIVRIRHNSIYSTAYLHLSGFGKGVRSGARVRQGQVIGYVGSTGLSTGPHLDFRFYKGGQAVDPLRVESPPVEPVLDEYREDFEKVKKGTLFLLDRIQ